MRAFEVARRDLGQVRWVDGPDPTPDDGEILLAIERLAISANTVTYGLFGEAMHYWQYFPASEPDWGRLPAWGFARVVRSRCPGIEAGERLYGFLPMATHLVVRPARVLARQFMDAVPHRRELPAAYQLYRRISHDPGHRPELEDAQALFAPLYITSFLLDDLLVDEACFGARSILISSASSKTALGLAQRLALQREGTTDPVEVIGLTSPRNKAFCEALGYYDRIVDYASLESLPSATPTVLVDFAGQWTLIARVHRHFGQALRHSCLVGFTHQQAQRPETPLPGVEPRFFFAPERIRKRSQDWGTGGIDRRFDEAWAGFAPTLARWLDVERCPPAQWPARWRALLAGQVGPRIGLILETGENASA